MVNFFVWSVLVLSGPATFVSTADLEANESRFVEVIIRDLEQSQFLHKIEDKVILFPTQLREQLEAKLPLAKTETEDKQRVRRSPKTWAQTLAEKRQRARLLRAHRRAEYYKKREFQRKRQEQQRLDSEQNAVLPVQNDYTPKYTSKPRKSGWTSWSNWTRCNVSCGDGYRTRRRFCANASMNSASCPGLSSESVPCGGSPCQQYEWSSFTYTECSKPCGGGETYATRQCNVKGTARQVADKNCQGHAFAKHPCNTQKCQKKVEYEWTSYRYLECSRTCGGGTQYGTRQCMLKGSNKSVGDQLCNGHAFYERPCNTQPCRSTPLNLRTKTVKQCGIKPKEEGGPKNVQLRITGGQVAEDGDWPWQVSLQHRTCKKSNRFGSECTWKHMCGASIVDQKWVVTAAHCIEESGYYTDNNNPGDDWAVVIGMDKLNYNHEGKNAGNDGKRFLLKRIIPHPDYVFTYITHADIALLQLRDAMEYADDVQPICLPNGKEPAHGERCHITGWGYTHGKGEVLSHHLRHATIPMVNFGQCRKTGIWYKLLKEDVHMCGGDVSRGGIDSCGGDSGGPLTCQDASTGLYYLAGVTSFGFSDCGKRGHLGIYARMTTFESWIQRTIDEDDKDNDYDDHEPFYGGYQYYSQYKVGTVKMFEG